MKQLGDYWMKWSANGQDLIDWFKNYHNKRTTTKFDQFYLDLLKEIKMGPTSKRALSGELQNGLRLMKKLVDEQEKSNKVAHRSETFNEFWAIIHKD